eukprot:TRINITY_DN141_c0_g1_i8.p1 TRINITY_DN141_c0_g1~~TRINITY_DN141_c0_g1_i8.p1  ORF type:complete len:956 (+),score=193.51 TRINITY_DN141_c0_g1_i8:127-2868(+)
MELNYLSCWRNAPEELKRIVLERISTFPGGSSSASSASSGSAVVVREQATFGQLCSAVLAKPEFSWSEHGELCARMRDAMRDVNRKYTHPAVFAAGSIGFPTGCYSQLTYADNAEEMELVVALLLEGYQWYNKSAPEQSMVSSTFFSSSLDNEYFDDLDVVGDFIKKVDACDKEPGYHRVVAVVQSSGFGKTRMCKQIVSKHGGVMWCLRKSTDEGVPSQTKLVYEKLMEPAESSDAKIRMWEIEVMCWLQVMVEQFEGCDEEEAADVRWGKWWAAHVDAENDEVQEKIKNLRDAAGRNLEQVVSVFLDALEKHRERMVKLEQVTNDDTLVLKLFVDEASTLVKMDHLREFRFAVYLVWRRIKASAANMGLMAVLCDTLSTISNFVPDEKTRRRTPASFRPDGQVGPFGMHAPFWNLSCDVYKECTEQRRQILDLKQLVSFGRPMWRALYDSAQGLSEQDRLQQLVMFAYQKLLLDRGLVLRADNVGGALAVVLARVFCVVGTGPLSVTYVSQHMGTCRHILESREALVVATCPEPVLAMAAEQYVWADADKLALALDMVLKLHATRQVSLGERGETAAQVLLARAYTAVKQGKNMWVNAIPVREVLRELGLHDTEGEKLKAVEVYARGHLAILQFVKQRRNQPLSMKTLEAAARRGCGLVLADGHKGLDLIIPVLFANSSPPTSDGEWTVGGLLLVQVKNREASSNNYRTSHDLSYKMCPPYVFGSSGVDWQVGEAKAGGDGDQTDVLDVVEVERVSKWKVSVAWLKEKIRQHNAENKNDKLLLSGNKADLKQRLLDTLNCEVSRDQVEELLQKHFGPPARKPVVCNDTIAELPTLGLFMNLRSDTAVVDQAFGVKIVTDEHPSGQLYYNVVLNKSNLRNPLPPAMWDAMEALTAPNTDSSDADCHILPSWV